MVKDWGTGKMWLWFCGVDEESRLAMVQRPSTILNGASEGPLVGYQELVVGELELPDERRGG